MSSAAMLTRSPRRVFLALALVLAAALGSGQRIAAASDQVQVEGQIAGIASSISATAGESVSTPSVSLLLVVDGSPVTVALAPDVRVLDAGGTSLPVETLDLRENVRAFGVWQSATLFLAHWIEVAPEKP